MAALVVVAWMMIKNDQAMRLGADMHANATRFAASLEAHISTRLAFAQHIRHEWLGGRITNRQEFIDEANSAHDIFGDFQAINWMDPEGVIRWVSPVKGNEASLGMNIRAFPRSALLLATAERTGQLQVTRQFKLAQGGKGFVAFIPIIKDGVSKGFIDIVFRTAPLVRSALQKDLLGKYHITVTDDGQTVYDSSNMAGPHPHQVHKRVRAGNRNWEVAVIPTRETIDARSTAVDEWVLFFGLLLSAGTSFLVWQILLRQRSLHWSESRFRDFARASSDFYWEMNERLQFSYFSDRFTEVTGVSQNELLDRTREEAPIPNIDDEAWQMHLADLAAHRPFRNFEHQRVQSDGSLTWLSINGNPIFDPDGTFAGYRGTGTNITERKRTEAALRENEEHFRNVIDHLPSFIAIKDTTGRFNLINRKHSELFGVDTVEIVGKNISYILPDDQAQHTNSQDRKVMETGSTVSEEMEVAVANGNRDFLITKFPFLNEAGEIKGVGTIGTDITDLKRAEKALQKSEQRLRGAIESIQDGFVLFDSDDRIVTINDVYRHINPRAQEFLDRGLRFEDLIRANVDRDWVVEAGGQKEAFIQNRLEQHSNPGTPIRRQFADGRWFIITETRTPEGGTALIFNDVSDLMRAESQLNRALAEAEAANQAKSEFLAVMSHELRTPLNAIIGFAQMLSHQIFGPIGEERYRQYADDINASSGHLLNLVNDILDLSAIEAGKHSLTMEEVHIAEVIKDCSSTILAAAKLKEIEYEQEIPSNPRPLQADRRALKQILLNLLSNAVKFAPIGGRVTLSTTASEDHQVFEIRDDGEGVPEDKLALITEPFVRGESNPHKAQKGTGLGLSIVKSLVALHDGDLNIESKVGEGTVVTVTLPNGAA